MSGLDLVAERLEGACVQIKKKAELVLRMAIDLGPGRVERAAGMHFLNLKHERARSSAMPVPGLGPGSEPEPATAVAAVEIAIVGSCSAIAIGSAKDKGFVCPDPSEPVTAESGMVSRQWSDFGPSHY
jgi:hypothetical protein